jgi:predicted PurR-regulated permease PerM|tara:strand:+ start:250 stop:459 length:210 start_codon:yes stop_codon:yes gene_type:complete
MKDYKGILSAVIVLVFAVGLMGILGLIVVDEFMMANENGGELDSNIIELLQMSITGIIGLVAGYVGGKN